MMRNIISGLASFMGGYLLMMALCALTGCGDSGPSEAEVQRERAEAAERQTQTWKYMVLLVGAGLLIAGVMIGTSATAKADDDEPRP